MNTLAERLNKIEKIICDPAFRKNKGLGNEVGYYIFDYSPKFELNVREHIEYISTRINQSNLEFKVIEYDLYDITLQILKE
jgi:hypothetical protein